MTTFNPDLSVLREQLSRTAPQVEQVIVVDNGSSAADSIRVLVEGFAKTHWFSLGENRGLGYAHNLGIGKALEEGAESVLILDQDTLPEADMVSVLAETLVSSSAPDSRVAAVGARYVGAQSKKCFCAEAGVRQVIPADVLISSGALFSASALREIGTMDEGLFIDHVDTEWFLRAHHRGWRSYGVCDAVMRHSLGERTFRVWLGRWRYLPIHKPFRYYYIYRNSVLLYRRSYPTIRWKQTDILRLLMMFVMFAVFAGDRVENLKMMCLGIKHGVRGNDGPLMSEI